MFPHELAGAPRPEGLGVGASSPAPLQPLSRAHPALGPPRAPSKGAVWSCKASVLLVGRWEL